MSDYPHEAGHRGIDTSIAAADKINGALPRLQREVFKANLSETHQILPQQCEVVGRRHIVAIDDLELNEKVCRRRSCRFHCCFSGGSRWRDHAR